MNTNDCIISRQPTADSRQPTADSRQPTADSHNYVLVSIIIPAYNTGEYIHRAIESSLRQTHSNIEVIVVDDGSKDNTLEVSRSYAERDSRVRVFHKENGGVSSARNMGIREALGKYMMFLDSDDWLEDCAVYTFIDAQEKYPDKVISAFVYSVIFDSKIKSFRRTEANSYLSTRIFDSAEETVSAFHILKPNVRFFHTVATKIFKTNLIRENNLQFQEKIHYGEDQIFMLEYLCKQKGTVLLNKPLINILERPGSAERCAYADRKIFTDGKLKDYLQIMIDIADTPELKKLLKFHHSAWMKFELNVAFRRGADIKKINIVRKKLRMYPCEYITSNKVSFIKKLDFLCGAYLPVPFAKFVMLTLRYVNDAIKSFKNRHVKEEIISYW